MHIIKKKLTSLNRLYLEIWTLKFPLVRFQEKVRNLVEKARIILENTCYKQNIARYVKVKDMDGEDSKGNKECVNGNFR